MEVFSQNKQRILDGIKNNESDILTNIYHEYFPGIKKYILDNSGNTEDAKDIFQEAILIIYRKLKDNNLNLTGSFKGYLNTVCRYLWLKQLEKRKKNGWKVHLEQEMVPDLIDDIAETQDQNERYKLYWTHFEELGDDCKKILRLFIDKVPLRQIADIMGYGSEQYAKKKKFQCKEALVRRVKNDLTYNEIT